MNQPTPTDRQIIDGIQCADTLERTLFCVFVRLDWRGAAIGLVMKMGGSEPDGDQAAGDALMDFQRNIRADQFRGSSSLKTYFLTIVKRKWWQQRQAQPAQLAFDENLPETAVDGHDLVFVEEIGAESRESFERVLAQMGDRCKQIFELVVLKTRHEIIAQNLGLRDALAAKKEVYRCRLRFRSLLLKCPAWANRLRQIRHES